MSLKMARKVEHSPEIRESQTEIPLLKQAQRVNPHGSMKYNIGTQTSLLRASSQPRSKGVTLTLHGAEKQCEYTGEGAALKWNSLASQQYQNKSDFDFAL